MYYMYINVYRYEYAYLPNYQSTNVSIFLVYLMYTIFLIYINLSIYLSIIYRSIDRSISLLQF